MDTLTFLTDATVAALFGGMIFFVAAVAPQVFKSLDERQASAFLRDLFPAYYGYMIAISTVAAALAVFHDRVDAAVLVLVALSTVAVRQGLMPRINAARDAQAAGDRTASWRFSALHMSAVFINAVQILMVLFVLAEPRW